MLSFLRMPHPELRRNVWAIACEMAFRAYLRRNPGQEDRAVRWASANWRQYKERAIDLVALLEVNREAEAAPRN